MKKRPSWEELAEKWGQMTKSALAQHYGVSVRTLYKWRRDAEAQGITLFPESPQTGKFHPPPWEELAEKWGQMKISALAQHYGVSVDSLYNWQKKAEAEGITFPEPIIAFPKRIPPPPWEELAEKWEELAEKWEQMKISALAHHYGVSKDTLYRWRKKAEAAGVTFPERQSGNRRNIPPPPPWEELAEKWGQMSKSALAQHYGVSAHRLYKWKREAEAEGITLFPESPQRDEIHPPPWEELAEKWGQMSKSALARHYGVSRPTLNNWRKKAEAEGVTFTKPIIPKPITPPWEELAEKWGQMTTRALAQHYGVSVRTLYKWRREAEAEGITFTKPIIASPKQIPPPPWEDLVDKWGQMTKFALAQHYGVSVDSLYNWRKKAEAAGFEFFV